MNSILQDEKWEVIPDTDGRYLVSSLGRVKRIFAYRYNRHNKQYMKIYKEYILKPYDNGNGYKMISYRQDGKRYVKYVHRLVAEAFIPNEENKKCVNHLDFNKSNNAAENLEWCTVKENVLYSAPNRKKHKAKSWSSTGEQYIYYRKKHDKYRVVIDKKEYPAKSLEEAIVIRNRILQKEVM